jgi:hypothetical protein
VGVVSAAMVVALAPVSQAALPRAASSDVQATLPEASAAVVESRRDEVSAAVTAMAQGARVEVEDLRTETSSTWANPDGTMTTEQHGGPIRFRNAAGDWVPVDLGMEANADGTVGAVGHVGGLSLAGKSAAAGRGVRGASGTDAVAVDEKSGRGVTLAWPGALPAPALKGESATYVNAAAGVDLVVHSRRSGFESDVVIKTAAALDGLVKTAAGQPVSFSFPLKTRGLTARAETDGGVSFVDQKGEVVSWFAPPVAWDAAMDPRSGNHLSESPVEMTVSQQGKGRAILTLTPDAAWLASPDRQFPVTIDPTYASGPNTATTFDTYVSSMYPTATYSTDTELRVGTYNSGADKVPVVSDIPAGEFQGQGRYLGVAVAVRVPFVVVHRVPVLPAHGERHDLGDELEQPAADDRLLRQPDRGEGLLQFLRGRAGAVPVHRVGQDVVERDLCELGHPPVCQRDGQQRLEEVLFGGVEPGSDCVVHLQPQAQRRDSADVGRAGELLCDAWYVDRADVHHRHHAQFHLDGDRPGRQQGADHL